MSFSFFVPCFPDFFIRFLSCWQGICFSCGKVHLYLKLHKSFQMDCFNMGTYRSFMGIVTVDKSWPAVPGFCLTLCKGSSHYSSRQKPLEGQADTRFVVSSLCWALSFLSAWKRTFVAIWRNSPQFPQSFSCKSPFLPSRVNTLLMILKVQKPPTFGECFTGVAFWGQSVLKSSLWAQEQIFL